MFWKNEVIDLPANVYRYYKKEGVWISYSDFFSQDNEDIMSEGERKIANYLNKNKIDYVYQKRYDDCKNKSTLPFDFYLPDYNTIIEFDGYQHYYEVKMFGKLSRIQKHDKIKNNYCKENNINLLRIPYWELENETIEKTIDVELNKINL